MYKTVVRANSSKLAINLRELWQYRDLFWVLAYRDIRVRYTQAVLGFLWAFIQPAATLLIFVLIFGKALNVDSGGIPYPLFALSGMALWTYFAFVLNQSGTSLISSSDMVKKIYFPRLVLPLSKAAVGFIDLAVALIFMIVIWIFTGYPIQQTAFWFPFLLFGVIFTALAVGVWISALTIRFRDFQYVVPFLVQFGLYASPVGYRTELITSRFPEKLAWTYYLNPMAGWIEAVRGSLFGLDFNASGFLISAVVSLFLFITGIYYFSSVERTMADLI